MALTGRPRKAAPLLTQSIRSSAKNDLYAPLCPNIEPMPASGIMPSTRNSGAGRWLTSASVSAIRGWRPSASIRRRATRCTVCAM